MPAGNGIRGQKAPNLGVTGWLGLQPGDKAPEIDTLAGKVAIIVCFQAWCPGSRAHGVPNLAALHRRFAAEPDVVVLAVHTVFEGYEDNTIDAAASLLQRHGAQVPLAHDPGTDGRGSQVLRRYHAPGTPWIVVVDREGVVVFEDYHASLERLEAIVHQQLQAELAQI